MRPGEIEVLFTISTLPLTALLLMPGTIHVLFPLEETVECKRVVWWVTKHKGDETTLPGLIPIPALPLTCDLGHMKWPLSGRFLLICKMELLDLATS